LWQLKKAIRERRAEQALHACAIQILVVEIQKDRIPFTGGSDVADAAQR
jgi:hypothetical protein